VPITKSWARSAWTQEIAVWQRAICRRRCWRNAQAGASTLPNARRRRGNHPSRQEFGRADVGRHPLRPTGRPAV